MKNRGSYRFKVGNFECICISDGSYDYPLEAFFKNIPRAEVEVLLKKRNLPIEHISTPYTYLYVDTGTHNVLVDVGAGGLSSTTGKLLENMKAAGIDPASIDIILITHAHPDHIGGILDKNKIPVFPNASYHIWKREYDFWNSDEALQNDNELIVKFAHIAKDIFDKISERIRLVDFENGETKIITGVFGVKAPGHTPGHMVVYFVSEGEKLVYIGDTVLYPIHLEKTDWVPIFDIIPDKAEESKMRIFNMVAEENIWVIGQHFPPFPSLGHVAKKGEGWEWKPLQISG